jgi:hypothetical protein
MASIPVCDFCGLPATTLVDHARNSPRQLELDEDGLWVCSECQARLISKPTGYGDEADSELDEKLTALIGKSAGAICRTMDLPYQPPYQAIIDAASKIAYDEDRYMSAWLFVTQWMDGTTVWQSEDRRAKALVYPDGSIQVENRAA